MKRIVRAWRDFWFLELDARVAARFRIALGGVIALYLLSMCPDWTVFYGPTGPVAASNTVLSRLSILELAGSPESLRPLWWSGFAAALAFTAGLFARIANLWLFILFVSLGNSAPELDNGGDYLIRQMLFIALFMRIDSRWSLSCSEEASVPGWPVRLAGAVICLVYLITGLRKCLVDPAWLDGTAVYWILSSPEDSRWTAPDFVREAWFHVPATYGILAAEFAIPLALWTRLRRAALVCAIALHAAILATVKYVIFFNLSMIAALLLFWPERKECDLLKR